MRILSPIPLTQWLFALRILVLRNGRSAGKPDGPVLIHDNESIPTCVAAATRHASAVFARAILNVSSSDSAYINSLINTKTEKGQPGPVFYCFFAPVR
jgi:hypothetical protein